MDNAPYHNGRSDNCFFAAGKSKDEIAAKLSALGCRHLEVKPYTELEKCPPVPSPTDPTHHFEGWVFCEKSTGECYMVDEAATPAMWRQSISPHRFPAIDQSSSLSANHRHE